MGDSSVFAKLEGLHRAWVAADAHASELSGQIDAELARLSAAGVPQPTLGAVLGCTRAFVSARIKRHRAKQP